MVLTRSQTKLMEANMLEVVIDFDCSQFIVGTLIKKDWYGKLSIYISICSKMENAVIGRNCRIHK